MDEVTLQYEHNKLPDGSAYYKEAEDHARGFVNYLLDQDIEPASILDAGCRTGMGMAVFQTSLPSRVVGVDLVPQFVEEAAKIGDAHVADLSHLPFHDGEFEWIYCSHTLEHCESFFLAFAELKRVATHGLYIVLPLENEELRKRNPSHKRNCGHPAEWLYKYLYDDHWWPSYLTLRYDRPEITVVMRRIKVSWN